MNTRRIFALALATSVGLSLVAAPLAFAKPAHGGDAAGPSAIPGGFGKGKKTGWQGAQKPPGWTKGQKKGWGEAGMPPGLAKKPSATSSAAPAAAAAPAASQSTQS